MAEKTIMAVGAHADDVEIYVGGTLLKYQEQGYRTIYVMATNNMSGSWTTIAEDGTRVAHHPPFDQMIAKRREEATAAARECFHTEPVFLDHPQRHYTPTEGDRVNLTYGTPRPAAMAEGAPTILTAHEHKPSVSRLADLILETKPEAIVAHGPVNVDLEHVATCMLVSKAYRQATDQGHDGALLHWLDVTPERPVSLFGRRFCGWDTHVDVSAWWAGKLASIDYHASVIVPNAAAIEFPEWGPACNCQRAETFTVADWGRQPAWDLPLTRELVANLR